MSIKIPEIPEEGVQPNPNWVKRIAEAAKQEGGEGGANLAVLLGLTLLVLQPAALVDACVGKEVTPNQGATTEPPATPEATATNGAAAKGEAKSTAELKAMGVKPTQPANTFQFRPPTAEINGRYTIRFSLPESPKSFPPTVERWRSDVVDILKRNPELLNGLDQDLATQLVLAIIKQESGGNPRAESATDDLGAIGLMQVLHATINSWVEDQNQKMPPWLPPLFTEYGINKSGLYYTQKNMDDLLKHPEAQLVIGMHLLDEEFLKPYENNIISAIAAYNGGMYVGNFFEELLEVVAKNNLPLTSLESPESWIKSLEAWREAFQSELMRNGYPQDKAQKIANDGFEKLKPIYKELLEEWQTALALKLVDNGYPQEEAPGMAASKFKEAMAYVQAVLSNAGLAIENRPFVRVYCVYTVKLGDTLSAIAEKYNTTVHEIKEANPAITNPDLISPGQKINIPLTPIR